LAVKDEDLERSLIAGTTFLRQGHVKIGLFVNSTAAYVDPA
jgi:hypothetical protein